MLRLKPSVVVLNRNDCVKALAEMSPDTVVSPDGVRADIDAILADAAAAPPVGHIRHNESPTEAALQDASPRRVNAADFSAARARGPPDRIAQTTSTVMGQSPRQPVSLADLESLPYMTYTNTPPRQRGLPQEMELEEDQEEYFGVPQSDGEGETFFNTMQSPRIPQMDGAREALPSIASRIRQAPPPITVSNLVAAHGDPIRNPGDAMYGRQTGQPLLSPDSTMHARSGGQPLLSPGGSVLSRPSGYPVHSPGGMSYQIADPYQLLSPGGTMHSILGGYPSTNPSRHIQPSPAGLESPISPNPFISPGRATYTYPTRSPGGRMQTTPAANPPISPYIGTNGPNYFSRQPNRLPAAFESSPFAFGPSGAGHTSSAARPSPTHNQISLGRPFNLGNRSQGAPSPSSRSFPSPHLERSPSAYDRELQEDTTADEAQEEDSDNGSPAPTLCLHRTRDRVNDTPAQRRRVSSIPQINTSDGSNDECAGDMASLDGVISDVREFQPPMVDYASPNAGGRGRRRAMPNPDQPPRRSARLQSYSPPVEQMQSLSAGQSSGGRTTNNSRGVRSDAAFSPTSRRRHG